MLGKIKSKIVDKKHRKREVNRNVKSLSFDKMQNIAIVYKLPEDKDELMLLRKYATLLKEHKKSPFSLVFINEKEVPVDYTAKIDVDYFSLQDLSPLKMAKSQNVINFLDTEYDLLIDCSIDDSPVIENIVRQSMSKLKIGAAHLNHSSSFDIQIMIENDKNLRYLLKNIDHYITLLK